MPALTLSQGIIKKTAKIPYGFQKKSLLLLLETNLSLYCNTNIEINTDE